ncbi:hypothetical protein M413DRAFT_240537 [Hebeloma cylindrosporum]|uniref:Uncharacterized protein n=1 Tax=Hebeloma cylindrosporum TaxID=76867 RepID=A0A0C2XLT9_HEBCY|nr:hypothetical protein M413DRAFT_240537 [Hebeloma cylindrosporum h7]
MASSFLKSICCGFWQTESESEPVYDETSRLIPEEPATDVSTVHLVDRQRLHERLSRIVRAKEGKMVNVASRIPFNIHNRVIPQEKSQSVSRSASRSFDDDYPQHYSNFHDHQRNRPAYHANYLYNPETSRSSSSLGPEAGPSSGTQSLTFEQPRPAPILNIRLVGYTDTSARGRTRERGPHPTGLPSPGIGSPGTFHASPLGEGESTPTAIQRPLQEYDFKFQDTGPLTVSWKD